MAVPPVTAGAIVPAAAAGVAATQGMAGTAAGAATGPAGEGLASGDGYQHVQPATPFALRWQPPSVHDSNTIFLMGEQRTMSEWIAAANRARFLKAGAALALFNTPIAAISTGILVDLPLHFSPGIFFATMGALMGSATSLYSAVQFIRGVSLRDMFTDLDKLMSSTRAHVEECTVEEFPLVMAEWYAKVRKYEERILKRGQKTVDGTTYNLVQLMDMAPFWKGASANIHKAEFLMEIEDAGREWTPNDLAQIQALPIHWKYVFQLDQYMETARWLARHGNSSIVQFVYDAARNRDHQSQQVFEALVNDKNPVALGLLAVEVDTGGITLVPRSK